MAAVPESVRLDVAWRYVRGGPDIKTERAGTDYLALAGQEKLLEARGRVRRQARCGSCHDGRLVGAQHLEKVEDLVAVSFLRAEAIESRSSIRARRLPAHDGRVGGPPLT